ncbi:MAG TPA: hypothetical protein DEG17_05560 [Cyanobacteria bacterium UBA11149]|nr:hypothetical protein [Cyanobacteria bacterium UBA11367]HBE59317.1 hypothetical protein [Cyanobacteria bacterium UBA11366]HBR73729.1 hypothetical protein [Cyanobacteria bacterium UBA11159]HBS68160.1 hypothetical protein [Cyanobacteria bacterium UBA11153]HBW88345.1 hypothetical protein [Cyanobacteria bacterium UBA11149]HCA95309.1 hypothetical protein [Cyanobacteria bacterium UBA9226]
MKSTIFGNALKLSPALLAASFLVGGSTLAAETLSEPTSETITQESEATLNESIITESTSRARSLLANDTSAPPDGTSLTQMENYSSEPASVIPNPDIQDSPKSATLEQIQNYSGEPSGVIPNQNLQTGVNSLGQVTNVGQLRDVSPGDWAYEALRNLVERYGCIAGYPDGTYRGNRAMTRYEFAAGLNACLSQLERIIGTGGSTTDNGDLVSIKRLVQEFQSELQTLGARVDNLEGRVSMLEDDQFSTTTKLQGEVLFALVDAWGDQRAVASPGTPNRDLVANTILGDRVRLSLDTTFTGQDLLRTRLQARNIAAITRPITGTFMTRLSFDGLDTTDNDVIVEKLFYRFPLGEKLTVQIDAAGFEFFESLIDPINPYFEDSAMGSISRFGRFSPIYHSNFAGSANVGAALNYEFSDALSLSLGYLSGGDADPLGLSSRGGLFNGSYTALAQLAFKPSEAIHLGLTYSHSYYGLGNVFINGATGSGFANNPFTDPSPNSFAATKADYFGLEANANLGKISVGGWVGFQNAEAQSGAQKDADADIWNWAVNLAFPDLGGEGNLLGFVFGMPPKVTSNDFIQNGRNREDDDTSFHIEALYRYQLTDNIAITPGLLVILNPEHNDNNDDIWVGTIRTTFTF